LPREGQSDPEKCRFAEFSHGLGRQPVSHVAEASFEFAASSVPPGGRVDLGLPLRSGERHFFIAVGGSVNADARRWFSRT
jgi:hypothetical protein